MTDYVHEQAEAALNALTSAAGDTLIAERITEYLLAGKVAPFKLALNHNGKVAPCPVRVDKPGAKWSSVTHMSRINAKLWLLDALARGYEIQAMTARGALEYKSVAGERRAIARRAASIERAVKIASGEIKDDDDIPF